MVAICEGNPMTHIKHHNEYWTVEDDSKRALSKGKFMLLMATLIGIFGLILALTYPEDRMGRMFVFIIAQIWMVGSILAED